MSNNRSAGILLHITSLPSKYGVGTLGKEAFEFVNWMKKSKLKIWQVLPLVPTNYGDSPYQSVSSTAVNYYMIDFDILYSKGLLLKKEYQNVKLSYDNKRVDYSLLFDKKVEILRLAFNRFDKDSKAFKKFLAKGDYNDFSLFMTIKELHNYNSWNLWNKEYHYYSEELEKRIINEYTEKYLFWQWTQFEFLNEWNDLHTYAKKNGIDIMGDIPLYVAYDSVEVWKYPEMFVLTEDKQPKLVAGCPPDVFSADGQLWGNPVYDWKYHKETGYKFWNDRINKSFELYDYLRIDHFRGFDRFYTIEAHYPNARIGEWLDGPKFDIFQDKTNLKIVAEDLGFIDEGVRHLMRQTGYPGMKILEFAFGGDPTNEHKPTNCSENFVIYTGTHDNMPLYQYMLDQSEYELNVIRQEVMHECDVLGVKYSNLDSPKAITDKVVELAFASKPNTCIIPIQDLLCLDGSSRMNLPSTVSTDNWSYRVLKIQLSDKLSERIKGYIEKYNR